MNADLYNACKQEPIETVKRIDVNCLNQCARAAAKHGKTDVVDYLLSRGAKPYFAMLGACRGGYTDIVERMYALDDNQGELEETLREAARGNRTELIDRLIEMGAGDVEGALYEACLRGHREFVDKLMSRGMRMTSDGLLGACTGGHLDLVKLMISHGAEDEDGLAVKAARTAGHADVVSYLESL